jgi:hypothetical protein
VFITGLLFLTTYIAGLLQIDNITNSSVFYFSNLLFSSIVYLIAMNILNNVTSQNTSQEQKQELKEVDSL